MFALRRRNGRETPRARENERTRSTHRAALCTRSPTSRSRCLAVSPSSAHSWSLAVFCTCSRTRGLVVSRGLSRGPTLAHCIAVALSRSLSRTHSRALTCTHFAVSLTLTSLSHSHSLSRSVSHSLSRSHSRSLSNPLSPPLSHPLSHNTTASVFGRFRLCSGDRSGRKCCTHRAGCTSSQEDTWAVFFTAMFIWYQSGTTASSRQVGIVDNGTKTPLSGPSCLCITYRSRVQITASDTGAKSVITRVDTLSSTFRDRKRNALLRCQKLLHKISCTISPQPRGRSASPAVSLAFALWLVVALAVSHTHGRS